MNILYCRVGWMNNYDGNHEEKPEGGGAYNKDNVGHEVYNNRPFNGKYFGFVQPGSNNGKWNTIHVENLGADKKSEFAEDVLVVWTATNPVKGGNYIVGWYKNATVYRSMQKVPSEVMQGRELKDHDDYNIGSDNIILVPSDERNFIIDGIMGQNPFWYGNDGINTEVLKYIEEYSDNTDQRIADVEAGVEQLEGDTKDAVVKVRINQDKFRTKLVSKYRKCCVCGLDKEDLLIASHIKPWSVSNRFEKLDIYNGLLLCPHHDKLFDRGYITFSNEGNIIISEELNTKDRLLMNINENVRIEIAGESFGYMKYHRENLFK